MADKLNTQQFAAKIRSANPGAYDDIPDEQLSSKVLAKYPQYQDMVQAQKAPLETIGGADTISALAMKAMNESGVKGPVSSIRSVKPPTVPYSDPVNSALINVASKFSSLPAGLVRGSIPGQAVSDVSEGINNIKQLSRGVPVSEIQRQFNERHSLSGELIGALGIDKNEVANDAQNRDYGALAGDTAFPLIMTLLGGKIAKKSGALAESSTPPSPSSPSKFLPPSVAEMTGTTPQRLAELKSFPQRIEGIRQTVIDAEQNAHKAASDQFPKFDRPIQTGNTVTGGEGPTLIDDWGEVRPSVPETTTFKALQERRSNLLKSIADEKRAVMRGAAPRFDLSDMSAQLNRLDSIMDKAALEQGGDAGLAQLQQARKSYRQYMDDFHNPGSPLRGILETKTGQTPVVIRNLLNPDNGARGIEALRKYGVNTSEMEGLLTQGERPVKVATAESAKLRKAGSDSAYTIQRLRESVSQATTNEMPSTAQARLPASTLRSRWPSMIGEIPGANIVTPRKITAWRLQHELNKRVRQ